MIYYNKELHAYHVDVDGQQYLIKLSAEIEPLDAIYATQSPAVLALVGGII